MSERTRIRLVLGVAIAGFATLVVLFARGHWGGLYDDALIYLRYVRNLRNGCGLRFNCAGPLVEGFTGPLQLALLYGGSFLTDRLIDLTQVIGQEAPAVEQRELQRPGEALDERACAIEAQPAAIA